MSSYRSVAGHRPWRRFMVAAVLSRLPITMGVFGPVLAGHALGSFALGARLAALYTITGAALSVRRGRRMDRGDLRRGLRGRAVADQVLAAGITLVPAQEVAALVAAGITMTPWAGEHPGRPGLWWGRWCRREDRPAAYALDAVCVGLLRGRAGPGGGDGVVRRAHGRVRLDGGVRPRPARGGDQPAAVGHPSGGDRRRAPCPPPGAGHDRRAGRHSRAGMGLGVLDSDLPAFAVRLGTRAAVGRCCSSP